MSKRISFNGQTFVVPDDATDDEITQIAGGGTRQATAPNAGLAPPAGYQPPLSRVSGKPQFDETPKYADVNVKTHLAGPGSKTILHAPEESGLETGPLVSHNPAENDTLSHGAGTARFLARAAHSAAQALNPLEVVPSIYHAAVDKPQDNQQAMEEAAAQAPNVPPALSRFLYRTAVKPTTTAISDYANGRVTPEAAANVAPEALGGAAGTVVGGKVLESLPSAAGATRKLLLPTTTEAGQAFAPIEAAAKNVPIDTSMARTIAEEAQRFGNAGNNPPPVIKKFLDRTNPTPANFPFPAEPAEPINYPEGRLFAQNAGALSASEKLAANAQMQRLVAKFADALKTANRDAAEKVGMGAQYDEAMRVYGKAANRAKFLSSIQDIATNSVVKKLAEGAGIGAAGYGLYKAFGK